MLFPGTRAEGRMHHIIKRAEPSAKVLRLWVPGLSPDPSDALFANFLLWTPAQDLTGQVTWSVNEAACSLSKLRGGKKEDLHCGKQWFYLFQCLPPLLSASPSDCRCYLTYVLDKGPRLGDAGCVPLLIFKWCHPSKDSGIYSLRRQTYIL